MIEMRRTSQANGIQRLRRRRLVGLIVVGALIGIPSLYTEGSGPTEYEVKAAYLYNFGKFVQWPAKVTAATSDSFAICVLGDYPFGPALYKTVAGETIDGKHVVVKPIFTPYEAGDCRILFISSSERGELRQILTALDGTCALTVSDMPEFVRRGGMIQFLIENNRVRFEINLSAAQHAGLILSSQLLKVAIRTQASPQPED